VAIKTIEHGNLYEDFELGRTFEHHWGRTVEAAESIALSTRTLNFNPLYFNREYAQALGHPDIVVNPQWVWMIVSGLTVEDLSEAGGPFLGVRDMTFPTPVYPGDTLYASSEVIERRPSGSRPGWGIVSWATEGRNQRGEVVMRYERTNLARMRDQSSVAEGK
jgi:itaconyl-CoA hydratase